MDRFATTDDLVQRVAALNRKELVALAHVGALNALGSVEHRRDALWQVEHAGRPVGPLLQRAGTLERMAANPLLKMRDDERVAADYAGTGLTTGPHPMAWERERLQRRGFVTAMDLERIHSERAVRIAGRVICRQRPGTAKGFVFLSLEDESGIANIIVTPDIFEKNRVVVTRSRYLQIVRLSTKSGRRGAREGKDAGALFDGHAGEPRRASPQLALALRCSERSQEPGVPRPSFAWAGKHELPAGAPGPSHLGTREE